MLPPARLPWWSFGPRATVSPSRPTVVDGATRLPASELGESSRPRRLHPVAQVVDVFRIEAERCIGSLASELVDVTSTPTASPVLRSLTSFAWRVRGVALESGALASDAGAASTTVLTWVDTKDVVLVVDGPTTGVGCAVVLDVDLEVEDAGQNLDVLLVVDLSELIDDPCVAVLHVGVCVDAVAA